MIFVAIAPYADPELPRTLRECVDNARWPRDLRFGICWQGDPVAPVPLNAFWSDERFRFLNFSVDESEDGRRVAWRDLGSARMLRADGSSLAVRRQIPARRIPACRVRSS